jgi:hypothetical protein
MVAALFGGAVPAQAPAVPRFEVDQKIIDLGEMIRGEVAEAVFVIRNGGGAALEILDAHPG